MGDAESGTGIFDRFFTELTTRELHDIIRLRSDVFVVEQKCVYPELDGRDTEPKTRHVWIAAADTPVAAYGRCLDDGHGISRLGRIVTAPQHRGQGHAARLVSYLVDSCDGDVILDAQTYLLDWYQRLGFERSGDDFVEDGIPHTSMRFSPTNNEIS